MRQYWECPQEELGVTRSCPGPTTLDVGHAELVEQTGDRELVGDRQGQPLLLGTIAQGGVVEVEAVDGHRLLVGGSGCGRGLGGRHRLTPAWWASRGGRRRGHAGARGASRAGA